VRNYLSRLVTLGAIVVPLAAAASVAAVHAQTPTTITMSPTAGREPGLAGTVTITPAGSNQVKVDIRITGLKPNDDRSAHIHSPGTDAAPCDTNGPVVYPLPDVKADGSGVGTSSGTITIDQAKGVPTAKWYVNVHVGAGAATGLGVICGAIAAPVVAAAAASPVAGGAAAPPPPAAGAAAPAAGATAPGALPRTGDTTPTAALLVSLALAGIVLAGTGLVVSRRRS